MTKVPLFSSGPAQYAIFRAMAIGFVCLYPVGIPLIFASILAANREKLSEDNSQSMDFEGFLVRHPARDRECASIKWSARTQPVFPKDGAPR